METIGLRPQMMSYEFLEDAYSGGGGFLNGSYLISHPREELDKYVSRQELSYYSNFVKPVVDSLTNPIFRKMIPRDWTGNHTHLKEFMDNVDRLGSTMNRFMKNAARWARLYGAIFIVVDNARDTVANVKHATENRAFPYVYFVKPRQVQEYKTDEHGHLQYIKYTTSKTYSKFGIGSAIHLEANEWEWWADRWKVTYHDGKVEEGENQLGFIPMVCLLGTDADVGDIMPTSPIISIARTNLAIYNICSELRELLRNQAFSILCYPITSEVDTKKMMDGIELGTDNMLCFDGTVRKAPYFIAPMADQAKLLQDEIQRLVEDIYRQASLTAVAGSQIRTSGAALQWDFEQTNQSLADMAENCEIAEREIVRCFCAYMNDDAPDDYKVIYPRDFGIVDVASELDKVAAALALNIGTEFDKQAKIKAAEAYLANIPTDEYDKVVGQIRRQGDDATYHGLESNNFPYNPVSTHQKMLNAHRKQLEKEAEEQQNDNSR